MLEERRRGEVEIPVTGITCASCVRRVEKALGKVEGVEGASVNLATEKARVAFDPEVADPRAMVAAIEKAGYGVREMPAPASAPPTKMPKICRRARRRGPPTAGPGAAR